MAPVFASLEDFIGRIPSLGLSSLHLCNDQRTAGPCFFLLSSLLPAAYLKLKHSVEESSKKCNNSDIRKKRSLLHEKFNASKVPEEIDYIVIGSGMAGLTCAAILARLGRKVVVLEQHHDTVGGGTHMFDLKGFTFDSGLHYTVPWSVPLFALTCLKKPKDCVPFDMMLEEDGTIDKVFLCDPTNPNPSKNSNNVFHPFRMQYHEPHLKTIYEQFPEERAAIDHYLSLSDRAMDFVKLFLFARLLPKHLQRWFWKLVPASVMEVASSTAKQLLPKFIRSKRLISLLSSLWIDTGARPDQTTFVLTASVFRGISMEGGCYPRGGSVELAKELVTVIESNGGRVFIRADVSEILLDNALSRVVGVRVRDSGGRETSLLCSRGVVSSTGYYNTLNNLVPDAAAKKFNLARSLPALDQSAGFVMANIGITGPASAFGATAANTWHIPLNEEGDIFGPISEYFADPFKDQGKNISAFITFPSQKDTSFPDQQKKTSCQMLFMAPFAWFEKFLPAERRGEHYQTYEGEERLPGYAEFKEEWKKKSLEIFLKYYPQAEPFVSFVDISTPLTIQHWLRATHGAAVGINSAPARFVDPFTREQLDPITALPGLALTGQDTVICGVTLCQVSGVITALRLEGFWAALKILGQSILLGNR